MESSTPQIALVLAILVVLGLALWLIISRRSREVVRDAVDSAAARLTGKPTLEPQYVECGTERIHYVQAGRGPHLVLIHGIGASVYIWRFLIEELAQRYTVTALDLPGFGKSSKTIGADYGLDAQHDNVIRFLDALKIGKARLVGSSMGGTIALWMAKKDPKRFMEVAVLAPATDPRIVPRRLSKVAALAPYSHKTLNKYTMRLILGQVIGRPDILVPDTIDAYLAPFMDEGVGVRTFLAAMELLGDKRLPECFAGLESRLLIVHGARDRMVSSGSIHRLCKILPKAELRTHPNGSHHIMENEPEWTTQRLLEFFSRK